MPLSLIVGPPNSGRAGAVRHRFTDALGRDPVLVVPTRDDADRFEAELCAHASAFVGGAVRTFPWLFDDIARATGTVHPPVLTEAQRLAVVAAAVREADLRILRASAERPGFAPALERLIGELQAAGIDPGTLAERADALDDGAYEAEIAGLYRAYVQLRDRLGRGDRHSLAGAASAALRRDPDSWGRRPVLLYGFDDLTPEELELLAALAEASDVTIAVTYEDRAAMAARAELLGRLGDEIGANPEESLEPDRAYTESTTLFHLERHLFEARPPSVEQDEGLVLLEAAGERSEAEQIGGEIARLLAGGARAGEIAVVLRSPDRQGPLYEQVLSELGIPVAVDASIPFSRTGVGRGILSLLRATFTTQSAEDLLTFLRTPGRARPDQADWLERDIRRNRLSRLTEALAAWRERTGWEPDEIAELRAAEGRALPALVARLIRRLAERPHRRTAPVPGVPGALELRAAAEASAALTEIGSLPGLLRGPEHVIATLDALTVRLWRGATEDRVRVLSPYRVRARRVEHLFVASLQEAEFPSHDPGEPLLADERRAALGLPPRRDPDDEERYLFYACVSRPSRRLYLSWRSTDEEGLATARSPFLDEVEQMLEPPGGAERVAPTRTRGLDRVVFAPEEAPSADELARALAALGAGADHADALRQLRVPAEIAEPVLGRLGSARAVANALPGPLEVEAAVGGLAAVDLFGASTLEEYALCSYRWFVAHELRPQNLEPEPEPLTQGAILHEVLERLYRDPPGAETLPRPGDVREWRDRASELLAEVSERRGLTLDDAFGRVARHRMGALLHRLLDAEARSESPLRPDPELIEARFDEGAAKPPLPLDGFRLHGTIDRVDVSRGARRWGLIQDYKSGAEVTTAANLERDGKLQLQLYMLALRELWGIEPAGGVYRPLGATDEGKRRPRGPLRRSEREGALAGLDLVETDFLDDERFDELLDEARGKAVEIVTLVRRGFVTRNPLRDRCPSFCRFQPICRRERAATAQPAPEETDAR